MQGLATLSTLTGNKAKHTNEKAKGNTKGQAH